MHPEFCEFYTWFDGVPVQIECHCTFDLFCKLFWANLHIQHISLETHRGRSLLLFLLLVCSAAIRMMWCNGRDYPSKWWLWSDNYSLARLAEFGVEPCWIEFHIVSLNEDRNALQNSEWHRSVTRRDAILKFVNKGECKPRYDTHETILFVFPKSHCSN